MLLYISGYWRYHHHTQKPETTLEKKTENKTSTTTKKEEDETSPKLPLEAQGRRTHLLLFTAFIFLLFACNNVAEFAYIFLDPFLQSLKSGTSGGEGLIISAGQAAQASALYGTAYTVGRGVSIPLSLALSPGNLLLLHYALGLLGNVGMFFSTSYSFLLVQLNTALVAYAFSALMPALFAFASRYSRVDDRRNALYSVALQAPSIFTPFLIGHFLQDWPLVLLVLEVSAVALAFMVYLVVRFVILRRVNTGVEEGKVGGN